MKKWIVNGRFQKGFPDTQNIEERKNKTKKKTKVKIQTNRRRQGNLGISSLLCKVLPQFQSDFFTTNILFTKVTQ